MRTQDPWRLTQGHHGFYISRAVLWEMCPEFRLEESMGTALSVHPRDSATKRLPAWPRMWNSEIPSGEKSHKSKCKIRDRKRLLAQEHQSS
jgi:hypothetical protein